MSQRITIPADFRGLDQAVHDSGAPTSSWLGVRLAQNDRHNGAHSRRSWGQWYPLGQPVGGGYGGWDPPQLVAPGRLGPWCHVGTPGCHERGGEWYLRAVIDLGVTVVAQPYVSDPPILPVRRPTARGVAGEVALVGTGAAATYGPIPTPLVEGPQLLGLVLVPDAPTSAITGNVWRLSGRILQSEDPDFLDLIEPYPQIRVLDSSGNERFSWHQIAGVGQTFTAGDTVRLVRPMCPEWQEYRLSDGLTWECSSNKAAPSVGHLRAVLGCEVAP